MVRNERGIRVVNHDRCTHVIRGLPVRPRLKSSDVNVNRGAKGPLFYEYRRGLLQHISYLDALAWSRLTNGPCSFFIRGYKYPFHLRKDYVGLLFMTSAAYKVKQNAKNRNYT